MRSGCAISRLLSSRAADRFDFSQRPACKNNLRKQPSTDAVMKTPSSKFTRFALVVGLAFSAIGSGVLAQTPAELNIATYADALKGGNSGPGIVPGNPDASAIVQMQSVGGHPGQLSIDELDQVIAWILAGAPER